jgi:hypothetical protein
MKTKDQKRREADERNAAWASFTPQQQLAMLDKSGLTATKQRAKIAAKIK